MACSGCMKNNVSAPAKKVEDEALYAVEASANPDAKVKLRYYGGGMKKNTGGCSTCSGKKTGYSITTSETIRFVSADAPNGLFKMTFSIGHDYYVTEKQAEYLLGLTYVNKSGQTVYKFGKV